MPCTVKNAISRCNEWPYASAWSCARRMQMMISPSRIRPVSGLTSGGSGTNTVMYYIYYTAFKLTEQSGHFGYANAMGVILAIFIGLLSALQFKLAKEK